MRILIGALFALTTSGCFHLDFGSLLSMQNWQEVTVEDNDADAKIAMVTVTGPMDASSNSGFLVEDDNIVASVKEQLDLAARDPDVKAVILKVSSPGGSIYPSMAVHREVLRFKERTHKPVVGYTPDVAASGGYMAIVAADEIISDPAALTGSIGVLAVSTEISGLAEWARVHVETFKTGKRKDVGNPFRPMTDEDRAEIQRFIEYYFEAFKKLVDENRPQLDAAQVSALADGGVFHATEAREKGLIDGIGDFYAAWDRASARIGLSSNLTNLITYRHPGEYSGSLYAARAEPATRPTISIDLTKMLKPGPKLQFMYLWTGE